MDELETLATSHLEDTQADYQAIARALRVLAGQILSLRIQVHALKEMLTKEKETA